VPSRSAASQGPGARMFEKSCAFRVAERMDQKRSRSKLAAWQPAISALTSL